MILDYVIYACLAIGLLFSGLGSFGLLRFPDVYTRLHASTKATTFGSIFTTLAVIIYGLYMLATTADMQFLILAVHAFIAVVTLAITNAIGSHAMARAAHRSGILPAQAVVDHLKEAGR